VREIANERPRASTAADSSAAEPHDGDIVLKPFIDHRSYKQLFRLETWQTHDLLDGPFSGVREAMEAAFEFGVTSRLAVWLDYSDDPAAHDLDPVPLFYGDGSAAGSTSVP
jgi:hypothetical protein